MNLNTGDYGLPRARQISGHIDHSNFCQFNSNQDTSCNWFSKEYQYNNDCHTNRYNTKNNTRLGFDIQVFVIVQITIIGMSCSREYNSIAFLSGTLGSLL